MTKAALPGSSYNNNVKTKRTEHFFFVQRLPCEQRSLDKQESQRDANGSNNFTMEQIRGYFVIIFIIYFSP